MNLRAGDKAPNFKLQDQNGKTHKLSDYLGKKVLIYFYPRDFTSGCTKEACQIRDSFPKFKNLNAAVLGISKDTVESHKKFAQRFKLPFIILADPHLKAIKSYDVYKLKKFVGKEYFGVVRTSFLIDEKGKIVKIYEKVKPLLHAEEVLEDLKN